MESGYIKCLNCGAVLNVGMDKPLVCCGNCGATLSVKINENGELNSSVIKTSNESNGNQKVVGNSEELPKGIKIILLIALWAVCFPILTTMYISKNQLFKRWMKIVIVSLSWIVYAVAVCFIICMKL